MLTRFLRLLAALSLATASVAFAQAPATTPGATPPVGQQRRPAPPPTNLKVLPKDLTGQQVRDIMRGYERQVGEECEHCHAQDPTTGRNDFPSDANPMKERARVMIKMTADINAVYLTQLTDPKPVNPVDCGTCHRGAGKPALFVPPPRERPAGPPAGAPATTAPASSAPATPPTN
jgi:hypothetical protein